MKLAHERKQFEPAVKYTRDVRVEHSSLPSHLEQEIAPQWDECLDFFIHQKGLEAQSIDLPELLTVFPDRRDQIPNREELWEKAVRSFQASRKDGSLNTYHTLLFAASFSFLYPERRKELLDDDTVEEWRVLIRSTLQTTLQKEQSAASDIENMKHACILFPQLKAEFQIQIEQYAHKWKDNFMPSDWHNLAFLLPKPLVQPHIEKRRARTWKILNQAKEQENWRLYLRNARELAMIDAESVELGEHGVRLLFSQDKKGEQPLPARSLV